MQRPLTGVLQLGGEPPAHSASAPSLPARLRRWRSGCHTRHPATPSEPPSLARYTPRAGLACEPGARVLGLSME